MTTTNTAYAAATPASLMSAARDFVPRLRELSPRIEKEMRLPADLVQEFVHAGFMHMMLPRDLGGPEIDPVTAARVTEVIASGDGSAGWCVMLSQQSIGFAGLLPAEDSRLIWGNGGIVAGTANPSGHADWTTDPAPGYRATGRWGFASGSSHATWFMGECKVYDGDQPRLDAQGNEVTRAVFVPASDVTVYPTWDTTGLRGTASNDFSMEGAFVPEGRGFQMLVSPPVHPWALYRTLPLLFINHGAHALGLARGAIDSGIEISRKKRGWGGVPLTELSRVQTAVAQATALYESASSYLYGTAHDLWDQALAGNDDPQLRARVRLATSNAATASVQAVDIMHAAVGTAGVFAENAIERQFRDVHTAAKHVMIGAMTYEAAGRVILGMEPQFPFF